MQGTISKIRARRDPVYFAEHFLSGVRLHNYQKHVLRTEGKTVVWAGGRGCGKSVVMAIVAIHRCITRQKHIVAYLSATQRQGKLFRDVLEGMIAGTLIAPSIEDSSYERIVFTNGSRLYIYPGGSSVAIRGLHNTLQLEHEEPAGITLIIDESAGVPHDSYVSAQGIRTSAPPGKSQMFCVGSPRGTNHWFYDEYCAGVNPAERHTVSFTTDSEACPHINRDVIEEMRAKLPPLEFRAEVKGEFVPELSGFFSGVIDSAVKPYSIPAEHDKDCYYRLGIDMALSARPGSSFTVFVLVERWWGGERWVKVGDNPDGSERVELQHVKPYAKIAGIWRYQYIDTAGIVRELQKIKARYPRLSRITTETYESTILEHLSHQPELGSYRVERLSPTSKLQNEAFPYFHQMLRDGTLQLPSAGENAKQLLKEMQAFQCKVTPAGNITYGGMDNSHDDCVYAACWGLWGGREYHMPAEVF